MVLLVVQGQDNCRVGGFESGILEDAETNQRRYRLYWRSDNAGRSFLNRQNTLRGQGRGHLKMAPTGWMG